jgi:tol-pal system protein YbgF
MIITSNSKGDLMRFFPLFKLFFPALASCFFLASCAADSTLQSLDFVELAEREADKNPAAEQAIQPDDALVAPEPRIPRTPQNKAELAAWLEELYLAQHAQEFKISLLQGTLEQQQNEIALLRKNFAEAAPERPKAAGSGRAAQGMQARPAGAVSSTDKSSDKSGTAAAEKADSIAASERQAYKAALSTLEAGRAQAAEALFMGFLVTYPKSSLAPNAEYWLGECFYTQNRYSDAILAFQNVVAQYPKHHKASASLLKVGYAYERLDDRQNALFYLQQLVENYPGSEPESLARAALNRLRAN